MDDEGLETSQKSLAKKQYLILGLVVVIIFCAAVVVFLEKDPIVGTWVMPVEEIAKSNPDTSSTIWNLVSSGGYLTNSMQLYENNSGDVAAVFEYKIYFARIVYFEVHEPVMWEKTDESVYRISPAGNISLDAGVFEGVPSVLLDKIPGMQYLSDLNELASNLNAVPENLKQEVAAALRPPVVPKSAEYMEVTLFEDEKGAALLYKSQVIYRKV